MRSAWTRNGLPVCKLQYIIKKLIKLDFINWRTVPFSSGSLPHTTLPVTRKDDGDQCNTMCTCVDLFGLWRGATKRKANYRKLFTFCSLASTEPLPTDTAGLSLQFISCIMIICKYLTKSICLFSPDARFLIDSSGRPNWILIIPAMLWSNQIIRLIVGDDSSCRSTTCRPIRPCDVSTMYLFGRSGGRCIHRRLGVFLLVRDSYHRHWLL